MSNPKRNPQSDKLKDAPADKAEHDALRALLAGKGLKAKDVDDAAGKQSNGRTRKQIADDLIAWARQLPKA